MRPSLGFALLLLTVALTQGQLVVPQFNHVDGLISLLPHLEDFVHQFDSILTSTEIQSLKAEIMEVVLSEITNQGSIGDLIDKLQPIIEHYLASKPTSRQLTSNAVSLVHGLVLNVLGKRETLPPFSDLFNVLNGLLSPSQIQSLKDRVLQLIVKYVNSKWDVASLTTELRTLFEEYLGSMMKGRSDIDTIIQQIISTTTSALPSVILGMIGGKRSLNISD